MRERGDGSADAHVRLLAIYTHPVQYYAPLFREITARHPEVDFEVLYLTRPTADQQGQGFGVPFHWDTDLLSGYRSTFFREPKESNDFTRRRGIDAPGIAAAIRAAHPDVVLLPGWGFVGLLRALLACNRLGIPVIYRGDTSLWQRPKGLRSLAWHLKNSLVLSRFSGFAAVGKRARIFLERYGVPSSRLVASPHAVDGERIRALAAPALTLDGRAVVRRSLGVGVDDFAVLYVGKLEPTKRPEDAVRAVGAMGEGTVLAVCGAGPLEDACRAVARREGACVRWLGFRNQSELPAIYAAADALVLPSSGETWGLVVNEAMSVGTPCVVSDAVGCGPDLVDPGRTGEVYPVGDVSALVEALQRIRSLAGPARGLASSVVERERAYSLAAATRGIAEIATRLAVGRTAAEERPAPRVLALCDGMVILGGMERRTMEIFDWVSEAGARVHCVFEHRQHRRYRLVHRAEQGGHSWSGVRMTVGLFSGERSLRWAGQLLLDVLSSSVSVLGLCFRQRPGVVFVASFGSTLRNWPALVLLRLSQRRIVLRSGNAPAEGSRHWWIWRWLVDSVVSAHVANSDFIRRELVAVGIHSAKVRVIRNPIPSGPRIERREERVLHRIMYVGQVLPEKGILEFLEAVALLLARGITVEAVLVGRFHGWEHPVNRGYKDAIAARVREFPSRVIRVLGEREDVVELMAACGIHCCPSQERQREGLATVVLQAKAAGIPSVVTPSGALPEMVRHRVDGWVCDGFGPEEIAQGLAYFLRDPEACARAGLEASRWREESHLPEAIARQWQEVLSARVSERVAE